jgi:outer membrane receptor protein involved in Fe transport
MLFNIRPARLGNCAGCNTGRPSTSVNPRSTFATVTAALAFSFLFIFDPGTALAQQTPAQADSATRDSLARIGASHPARLGTVTITTTPADRREPSSATHVTPTAIALAPAATPWELLRQTAGMEVHQAGQGPGFASDASIRGFSSDHSTDLALWIDGVPVNEPVNGHAEGYNDWSLIFPETVRDIDVIKGPTSSLFGNFALSGVVNVRTIERTRDTQIGLTGGSYGRAEASVISGFDHGQDGGGVIAFRALHNDGFRPNSGNDLMQGHGRVVRDISPTATLDAGVELYGARWNSPGYLSEQQFANHQYGIVSNPTDGGYKRRAQERVSLRVTHGDNVMWRSTAYATQGLWQLYLTIPPQGGQFEGSGSQTEEDDARYGVGLTSAVSYTTAHVDVTLGTEGRFDHARYQNYFTTARARDSVDALVTGRQVSGALFLQAGMDVSPYLRVNLGARYDAAQTRSMPDTVGATTSSATHGVLSPKLGALLHLTPVVGVYANASRGFRSSDGVLTDPTLVPITAWAYETGLRLDVNSLSASAALFRMNVSNEQTFNPLTSGSINGGSSRRRGVELDVRTTAVTHTALSANWTFNDARYTHQISAPEDDPDNPVDLSGLRVYNTAQYVGSAAIDFAPTAVIPKARWIVRLSGNWVGPYSPFDEPGVVLGAYGLMHLSARAHVTPSAVLDIGVRNVFDRAFPELVAGHIVAPGEPRSAYAGLRYTM